MILDTEENDKDRKNEMEKERRSFLKKTAYAAPALIILGQLARPTKVEAESCIPCDAFDPDPSCCGNQG